jgi:hypothetical protein
MRKFIVTVMASLLSCSGAFAFWADATDSLLEIGVGYRQDSLEWKVGRSCSDSYNYSDSNNDVANLFVSPIHSKLKWHDLRIWQIEAAAKYVTCDNLYLRATGDYGWVTSGKNRDRDSGYSDNGGDYGDYWSTNSRSHVKGHVYDADIAVGYQFKWCDDAFSIYPLIGYSWNGQHVHDNCSGDYYYSGSEISYGYDYSGYDGRNSSYHARWNGPFIGFDFDYRFGCGCDMDWELFGTYEFHWAEYHASANWPFISNLCNGFKHHADNAYGNVFDIGVRYDFCECWTLALKGEFRWFWADRGHDRAKFASCSECGGDVDCYLKLPLHDVRWNSAAVSIDLGMVF